MLRHAPAPTTWFRLTHRQRDAWDEAGFLVLRGFWPAAAIARMADGFERLRTLAATLPGSAERDGAVFVLGDRPDGTGRGAQIQRVVWCGAAAPDLLALGADPRLVALAAELVGADALDQLINQAHFKLPGDGVAFPWHQDSRHRRYGTPEWRDVTGRGSFVEIVTAVDRADANNGALQVIPGSHRAGHLPTFGADHGFADGAFDATAALTVALDPGDVVAFGPYLVHGSAPNRADAPRRSFLNGYAAAGANHRTYPGRGAGRRLRAIVIEPDRAVRRR